MVEKICVLGAGAFGTALAISIADAGRGVVLWGRDADAMSQMHQDRENVRRLPAARFAASLTPTSDIALACQADIVLLAVPTQKLRGLVEAYRSHLEGRVLIACCKGIEQGTGLLPTQVIQDVVPQARVGVLTGPSFAADIAVGKPTALTLAMADADEEAIQALLSTSALRIYLSDDMIGAQLGGALKNVIAIAAGIVIGAGLGDSARAALMTRALAEMIRYAQKQGGRSETLFGLSGFGDLVLTCTSSQSRNFRHGAAFGEGIKTDENVTVEGVTTAHAVVEAMRTSASESRAEEDLPLTFMVSSLLKNEISLEAATDALLARPLRRE